MTAQRTPVLSPFFIFALIVLIALLVPGIHNGGKLVNIYITRSDQYQIVEAKLLTNQHRKYNNQASYQFSYEGKTLEGSDGSILWGSVGKEVSIYLEKNNTKNNGILSGLIFLAAGQGLLFILLGIYVTFKLIRHARTP